MNKYRKFLLAICFFSFLSACERSITLKTGPNAISYFIKGGAQELKKCPPKFDSNWHQAKFEYQGLQHTFFSPVGLICVQDASGKYLGTYVDSPNSKATHRLEEGGRENFIPKIVFRKL
jgi:hypothetical protein